MKIVLIGAYGYTGQIVCELLTKKHIRFTALGRKAESIAKLQADFPSIRDVIIADTTDREKASSIVSDFDIFINCAGPFGEESASLLGLISAAQNKIYLDITGEVGFTIGSFEKYNELAISNNTLIVHGCAFESTIVDALSSILKKDHNQIIDIKSFYRFERSKASPGTKITMKLSKFHNTIGIKDFKWETYDKLKDQITVSIDSIGEEKIAVPYPLPEVAYAQWNLNAKNAMSYLLLDKESAMFVGQGNVSGTIGEAYAKLKDRKSAGPTEEERSRQEFEIIVQVTDEEKQVDSLRVQGYDMYKLTALCIIEALAQIDELDGLPSGVVSPGALFKNQEDQVLTNLGLTYTRF